MDKLGPDLFVATVKLVPDMINPEKALARPAGHEHPHHKGICGCSSKTSYTDLKMDGVRTSIMLVTQLHEIFQ